tara:strand:- start:437 stop:733 length:297 start_codon:yes stop_codon:yes gene_type:complete
MEAIIREHINTKHLSMSIAKIDEEWEWMKISVYSVSSSPYGWTRRELRYSPFGLDNKDVESLHDIEMYIREAVYHVYTFSLILDLEITELLNEIKEKI